MLLLSSGLEVRRLPGGPATKRISGYMPGAAISCWAEEAGRPGIHRATVDHLDLRIRVDRAGQRRAALMHASQT
jgi:hypothetical protein